MAGYSTPAWTNNAAPAINASNLLAMGRAIELAQHPYGVCSTAAGTAAKTVTLDVSGTVSLFTGMTVQVKFTNGNTASNPTLNVNSTGAVAIKYCGVAPMAPWSEGQIFTLIYDGTNWYTADGMAKLGETQITSSTSTFSISLDADIKYFSKIVVVAYATANAPSTAKTYIYAGADDTTPEIGQNFAGSGGTLGLGVSQINFLTNTASGYEIVCEANGSTNTALCYTGNSLITSSTLFVATQGGSGVRVSSGSRYTIYGSQIAL